MDCDPFVLSIETDDSVEKLGKLKQKVYLIIAILIEKTAFVKFQKLYSKIQT